MLHYLNYAALHWLQFMTNQSIHLVIIFFVVLVITFTLKSRSAKFLHNLWFVVILKALIPPSIEFNLFHRTAIVPDITFSDVMLKTQELSATGTGPFLTVHSLLFIIWIVIAATITLYFLFKNMHFFRKVRSHRFRFTKTVQEKLPRVQQYGQNYTVYLSGEISEPLTVGFFKPLIYLPVEAQQWNTKKLESVLMHEIAHIKRKDSWYGLLRNIVQIMYFYHPLLWIANRQLNGYQEQACDDYAILHSSQTNKEYGAVLLSFLQTPYINSPVTYAQGIINRKGSSVIKRFKYLVQQKEANMLKLKKLEKILLTGLFSLAIFLSCQSNEKTQMPTTMQQSDAKTESEISLPGTISGVIMDEATHERLPGANIFTSDNTYGTASNRNGEFNFNLPPGEYTVIGQFLGFHIVSVEGVQVKPGMNTKLEFQLTIDKRPFAEQVKLMNEALGR